MSIRTPLSRMFSATRRLESTLLTAVRSIFNPVLILTLLCSALLTTACNSKGSSAPPPVGGISVVAGENRATISWVADPGVEYWLFYAPASSISTTNWNSLPSSYAIVKAVSPQIVTGLVNDTTYAFTLNGRINGGPGGSGTPSVATVPRMAGNSWSAASAIGANDLRAVMSGATTAATVNTPAGIMYVAAGANGTMYSSSDAMSWTPINYTMTKNLYGAAYTGVYMVVGESGTILYSTDAVTWATETSGTTRDLYAIASNNVNLSVAVGAAGTILYSGDGKTWYKAANSATTNDLQHVVYGTNGTWVAVGDGGTIVKSTDGSNWQLASSGTVANLKGVSFGYSDSTLLTTTFVAVGASGTVLASADGTSWTVQTLPTASTLNAVSYGLQFAAVGDNGVIFTSKNGTSWVAQTSNSLSNLYGIVHSAAGFAAVGAAGTNLVAQ